MIRMLGTAVAALTLLCAGSASATIIFDFEDGQAGQPYPKTYFESGSLDGGVAVATSRGISLQLAEKPDYHGPLSEFTIRGHGYDGDWRYVWAPVFVSFDLLLPNGGMINYLGYQETYLHIQPGVWTTITFSVLNETTRRDCRYYCTFFINGGGALVDNVVVEPRLASIPEPSTWLMLIAGFGLTGAALRSARPPHSQTSRSVEGRV